ncbi:MAG: 3-deoxy-D-manno-octulosonic acid transferase [Acetobacteraceae bacterium]|nr:3-deoxy-D-manno-octulosonic acid transferase [Acetobacteraceae bacterium]
MSFAGWAWRWAATAAAPLLRPYLRWRATRGKEVAARLAERRGNGAARPPGRLLWLHAASVGETLSLLPLLEALAARAPDLGVLLTTGTATAAALLARRLPPALADRVQHRFAPLDVPRWVDRFLAGWRPDAGALVESELWPNLIRAARRRGVPLALVNARFSERSSRRWLRWAPGLARELLSSLSPVLAQTPADAARLGAAGARLALCLGNLKDAAAPLPADPAELARLRGAVGGRPVFLAASTHPGEEAIVLDAHRRAAASGLPDLLTVIVPRHPHRGPAIAAEAAAGGMAVARRAAGEVPGPGTAVHVADTLGELGLFYRLAGVCLVGGSLVPHGGQNPLEPARLGCPILLGPHTANFAEPVARLLAAGGALRVEGPDAAGALAALAAGVLSNPDRARGMADAAAASAAVAEGLPGQVADALLRLLPPPPDADRDAPVGTAVAAAP